MRKIQTYNAECLRKIAEDVPIEELAELEQKQGIVYELIQEMKDALNKPGNGLGLSAPQLGNMRRIIVMKDNDEEIFTVINPKIKELSKDYSVSYEGCLSLPGIFAHVQRPSWVTADYIDEDGKYATSMFTELESTVLLHEIDHLNGILFIDRCLNRDQRRLVEKKYGMRKISQIDVEDYDQYVY